MKHNQYWELLYNICLLAVPWPYVISELDGEEITGSFQEKEQQKASKEKFRIEQVLKTKGDKLCVKWKFYHNSFNSQIDKKDPT